MRRMFLIALLAGCGDGGGAGGAAPDAGGETPREPNGVRCAEDAQLGEFRIAPAKGFANVSGQVFDAVVPSVTLTAVATEAGCTLWKKQNPFCDPPCSGGDVCTPDGSCLAPPTSVDLGTVRITGLARPVAMEPVQPGNLYYDTDLTDQDVPVGAAIHLQSGAGAPLALDLWAKGPSPLEVTTDGVTVQRGEALPLAWAVPEDGRGSVRITLNIDQHGNSPLSLVCDVEDDGAHTIPASLIDRLLDAGVSGFPTAFVARESVDSASQEAGCVELVVRYLVQRSVNVVGHVPCRRDEDCSAGHCDLATETCVGD